MPTPVEQPNHSDMTPLFKTVETVGKVLKTGDTVIYESTVYPGTIEKVCSHVLEKINRLEFNKDFSCGYSPELFSPVDKMFTMPENQSTYITLGDAQHLINHWT